MKIFFDIVLLFHKAWWFYDFLYENECIERTIRRKKKIKKKNWKKNWKKKF